MLKIVLNILIVFLIYIIAYYIKLDIFVIFVFATIINLFITAAFWLEFDEESADDTYYSDTYNPRGNKKDDHTNY